ncbi:hypothetical protein HHL24_38185 [Paraburkholderia sp. RP-4-7]|jgi:hypothetical protein|uniref:Uncharacterized protein n=1 Tax=Paraburkholderia polaris TaxID=2728848 RepID=A0A848IU18_9BURK|nr:hypothetical protein [Paraburkholderia polaris]NMM03689.1 hypothetical protein [Paraburkholderia polaris]
MLAKLFKFTCLTMAVFYFGSGPIRVLLYSPPMREMLSYSSGVVKFGKIYRGGEYISLIGDADGGTYHCGYRQSGLDVGFCPQEIRGGKNIDGKQVVIGWYVQKRSFWAFSQRQVFEVRQGEEEVLAFDRAVKYYESQNSPIFCKFLLISMVLIYFIVLRKIFI